MTQRKFDHHDSAAIRRAVHKYGGKRLIVECGVRNDVNGNATVDSTRWDEDTDLLDMDADMKHYCTRETLRPGMTLDLYVYDKRGESADIWGNLDAKWNGTAWEICDPFAPMQVVTEAPR